MAMEKVLDLYSQPYDARYPVIYMDEHAKPLRADTRPSRPARPGCPATYDYEYVRHGTCTVWLFVEPLGPWRMVTARPKRLTRACDPSERSCLQALPPVEARRMHRAFPLRCGNWLKRRGGTFVP